MVDPRQSKVLKGDNYKEQREMSDYLHFFQSTFTVETKKPDQLV
jgi:hypothetical protein